VLTPSPAANALTFAEYAERWLSDSWGPLATALAKTHRHTRRP